MRRIILFTIGMLLAALVEAQPNNPSIRDSSTDPTGVACTAAAPILRYKTGGTSKMYSCTGTNGTVYEAMGAGSGAPVGGNFYAASYGVLANTKFVLDATTNNTSQTVTCPNSDCGFVAGDVGKIVFATSNSQAGTVIVPQGTISAVGGANTITVSIAATGSATATAVLIWGADDSAALTTAWAASAGACGTLVLPAGNMLVQSAQFIANTNTHCTSITPPWLGAGLEGVNLNGTVIIPTPSFNFASCTGGSGHACFGGTPSTRYHDFTIWGGGNSKSGVDLGGAVFLELVQSVGLFQFDLNGWASASTNSTCLLDGSTQSGNYQGGVVSCGFAGFVVGATAGDFGCASSVGTYYGPGGNGIAVEVKNGACLASYNDNFDNMTVDAGGVARLFGSNAINAGTMSISGTAHLNGFFAKSGGTMTIASGGVVDAATSFKGGYTVSVGAGGQFTDLGNTDAYTLSCSGTCSTVFPQPLVDDFTRANGAVGSPWAVGGGGATSLQISTNKAVCASSNCSLNEYASSTYVGPNQQVEVQISTVPTATDSAGVYVRMSSISANPNLYECAYTSGTGLQLFKSVAGSFTQLGSTLVVTPTAGDIVRASAVGTVITCSVGSAQPIRVVDSAVTTGFPGAVLFGAGKTGVLGPFVVTPVQ